MLLHNTQTITEIISLERKQFYRGNHFKTVKAFT
jgi:hypothetical protein